MITYIVGDLFESSAQVIVNPVNVVGVMGKGLAKKFKQAYPDMFKQYKTLCNTGELDVGKLWLYKAPDKWILNFPTKQHWRQKSKLEYIEAGLKEFVDTYDTLGIQSIAFPMLGCGAGGLDWEDVRPLMENYLGDLPIEITIYQYNTPSK